MAIHRCDMCGGTLEIEDNGGYAVCSYCGLRQPIENDNDSSVKVNKPSPNPQDKALRIENERRRAEEAKAKAEASRVQAEENRLKAETQRLERERFAEKKRMEREKRSKKVRSIVGKVFLTISVITLITVLTFTVIIPSVKYNNAVKAVEEQNYEEAYLTFKDLCYFNDRDFKDSKDRANQLLKDHPEVAQVGDVIVFGTYEQDNKTSNGKEEIEWKVLDKDADGNLFVISVNALDCRNYHSSPAKVTWETSDIRQWLNNDFYNNAFDESQRSKIKTTKLENKDNNDYNTDGGNDTEDKVFLLSIDEAKTYMPATYERICNATKYAESQGSQLESLTRSCRWWLRTPGSTQYQASFVKVDGLIFQMGVAASLEKRSVRPAMWLEF